MRDSYVGDIGDFANNGLLRHIFGGPGAPTVDNPLKLGVVWYLNNGPGRVSHGNRVNYLVATKVNLERFRSCDGSLYDRLQRLVPSSQRKVKAATKAGILPWNTLHYDAPVPCKSRQGADTDWFNGAFNATFGADVVFVNPDIGKSSDNNSAGPEYVSVAELKKFWCRGKSLIIYQHRPRTLKKKHEPGLINEWAKIFHDHDKLNPSLSVRVLRWNRDPVRFYFIVAQPCHKSFLDRRIEALKESQWCKKDHFREVPVTEEQ